MKMRIISVFLGLLVLYGCQVVNHSDYSTSSRHWVKTHPSAQLVYADAHFEVWNQGERCYYFNQGNLEYVYQCGNLSDVQ